MLGESWASCPASAAGSALCAPQGQPAWSCKRRGGAVENGKGLEIISPSARQQAGAAAAAVLPTAWKQESRPPLSSKEEHNLEKAEDNLGPRHLKLLVLGNPEAPQGVLMTGGSSGGGCRRNFLLL